MNAMHRPRFSLASRILAFQLAIVLGALLVGAIVSIIVERQRLDAQYEQRALTVAQSVAGMPSVRDALNDSDPSRTLQPLAEGMRRASGASFVVIAGANGIRYSHPNSSMIGKPIDEDPSAILAGHTFVGIQQGTLGVSARGKAPIFDGSGRVIGIASVGFLEQELSRQLASNLPLLALYLLVAVALGVIGSLLLARHLKRQTFGLEPEEIATLLEQREASLHGIREGTIATDVDGKVTLINDEARRLLRLSGDSLGRPLTEVLPPGRVRDLLIGQVTGADEVVLAADRVLVVSRMPVVVRGRTIGHVATFRDRTELESLLRELDNARSVTEALRAQAHDFSNRLHTIAGMIELGRHEEAIQMTTESSNVSQELTESLLERVGDPVLGALLLGKSAVAAERGIQFRLSPDSRLDGDAGHPRDLITVVGNLIDNALDAAATSSNGGPRWVEVSIHKADGDVVIQVHDSGPGIGAGELERIFSEGYTTKLAGPGSRRGLGLALVQQVATRRGGAVTVVNQGGALFTVRLPFTAKPVPAATA
ncbi:MAG: sensor histidine kinase [Chloroflexi bacterium]|nr:MAG: sensor histidine kinase [Chloroflexota bacterium]TME55519.1 MAG: sensor histidine kinase [Chloroflexota bacterium]